jgi:hypothetical protein
MVGNIYYFWRPLTRCDHQVPNVCFSPAMLVPLWFPYYRKPVSVGTINQDPNPIGGYFNSGWMPIAHDLWNRCVAWRKLNEIVGAERMVRQDGVAGSGEGRMVCSTPVLEPNILTAELAANRSGDQREQGCYEDCSRSRHMQERLTLAVSGAGPTPQHMQTESYPGVHSTALVRSRDHWLPPGGRAGVFIRDGFFTVSSTVSRPS